MMMMMMIFTYRAKNFADMSASAYAAYMSGNPDTVGNSSRWLGGGQKFMEFGIRVKFDSLTFLNLYRRNPSKNFCFSPKDYDQSKPSFLHLT